MTSATSADIGRSRIQIVHAICHIEHPAIVVVKPIYLEYQHTSNRRERQGNGPNKRMVSRAQNTQNTPISQVIRSAASRRVWSSRNAQTSLVELMRSPNCLATSWIEPSRFNALASAQYMKCHLRKKCHQMQHNNGARRNQMQRGKQWH